MAQILLQIPDRMLQSLERVAPGHSRKRSRFVRLALQKALMELEDLQTVEAYQRMPDNEPDWFDARVWDEWRPKGRSAARRRSPGRRPRRRNAKRKRAKR